MTIRAGYPDDLDAVKQILDRAPEAAHWIPAPSDLLVAERNGKVAGFLVWRSTAADEKEILNLAVDAPFRRQGIALRLVAALSAPLIFLEVRASNHAARALYCQAGFEEAGERRDYYRNPAEAAIVMRRQS